PSAASVSSVPEVSAAVVSSVLLPDPHAVMDAVMASARNMVINFFICLFLLRLSDTDGNSPSHPQKKEPLCQAIHQMHYNPIKDSISSNSASQNFCDSPSGISRRPSRPNS